MTAAATDVHSAFPPSGIDPALAELVEEFLQRLQAGEAVTPSSFAAAHAEHGDALSQLLPALEMMAELGRSAVREGAELPPSGVCEPGLGVLGDFRILREIGRGGMGVVYEAEQVSLGRRIALKVLPVAAAMDPRQMQRFHVEAHAAACLHHTNIVPIHAVGCERSVPYYAMQLIEGRSLADLILELRRLDGLDQVEEEVAARPAPSLASELANGQPAPGVNRRTLDSPTVTANRAPRRTVIKAADAKTATLAPAAASPTTTTHNRDFIRTAAGLSLQAAEALEHAHQRGVLHRDIKPANLLIDTEGRLWITDFGLALLQQGDARLTVTGDLLGTLRYMSPEQAAARRVLIDGRTDLYSLGVTLYELLSLRAAIVGKDRMEILRRIVEQEPVPLRRLNPAVPADLETIVQKAMAKEPESRYATARELADDLRRFLDDQPIAARRPRLPERVMRWLRRHPSVVAATVIILVLVLLGSVIGAVLIAREQRQTAEALHQASSRLAEKVDVLTFFISLLEQGSPGAPHGGTLTVAELIDLAEEQANGRFSGQPLVRAALDHALGRILYHRGGSAERGIAYLERALDVRRKLLGPAALETLQAQVDLNATRGAIDPGEALRTLRDVVTIERRTVGADHPQAIEHAWHLSLALGRNGLWEESNALVAELVDRSRRVLGEDHMTTLELTRLLGLQRYFKGEFDEARRLYSQALATMRRKYPKSDKTLLCASTMADALLASGDVAGARQEYARIADEAGRVFKPQDTLAYDSRVRALALSRYLGNYREATVGFEQLREVSRSSFSDDTARVLICDLFLGLDHGDIAFSLTRRNQLRAQGGSPPRVYVITPDVMIASVEVDAARGDFAQAIAVALTFLDLTTARREAGRPFYPEKHYMRSIASDLLARLLASAPGSLNDVPRAMTLAETNIAIFPYDGRFRTTLGIVQYRARRLVEAITTLNLAHQLDDGRRFAPRGFFLAMAYWQKGEKEKARDLFQKSVDWMDEQRPGHPELVPVQREAAGVLGLGVSNSNPSPPIDSLNE